MTRESGSRLAYFGGALRLEIRHIAAFAEGLGGDGQTMQRTGPGLRSNMPPKAKVRNPVPSIQYSTV
ncbi:MAG: hypothetical protein WDN69_37145 [Aliidongia sp.]